MSEPHPLEAVVVAGLVIVVSVLIAFLAQRKDTEAERERCRQLLADPDVCDHHDVMVYTGE